MKSLIRLAAPCQPIHSMRTRGRAGAERLVCIRIAKVWSLGRLRQRLRGLGKGCDATSKGLTT